MAFVKIMKRDFSCNIFKKLAREWALLTAGDSEKFNFMTIAWGGLGFVWYKPVTTVYVRPSRYTYEFMEAGDYYSLCFFGEEQRGALQLCGEKSGREIDKVKATGLTPVIHDTGAVYFEEAKLVIISKKLWRTDLHAEDFLSDVITDRYAKEGNDYHRVYTGEIIEILENVS